MTGAGDFGFGFNEESEKVEEVKPTPKTRAAESVANETGKFKASTVDKDPFGLDDDFDPMGEPPLPPNKGGFEKKSQPYQSTGEDLDFGPSSHNFNNQQSYGNRRDDNFSSGGGRGGFRGRGRGRGGFRGGNRGGYQGGGGYSNRDFNSRSNYGDNQSQYSQPNYRSRHENYQQESFPQMSEVAVTVPVPTVKATEKV